MSEVIKSKKVKVYYDGLCHLCSREIRFYQGQKGHEKIDFIDITAGSFRAEQEGLDPHEIHRSLHARDENGHLHRGVDAFILIWSQLENYRSWSRWASRSPVKAVLRFAYAGFARVRPLLPRKSCQDSPYCEMGPLR